MVSTTAELNSKLNDDLKRIAKLSAGRKFTLWRYYVSHSTLLLRSPNVGDNKQNIDIVFPGVTYMQVRNVLGPISIRLADDASIKEIHKHMGRSLKPRERAFAVFGNGWLDMIVSLWVYPSVNSESFLTTPQLPSFPKDVE